MLESLDDSVLTKQNLRLLDNITNYNKPALDYFIHDFDSHNELSQTWSLLHKMNTQRKILIRLPSCSIENEYDYNFYMKRLHHCLWRRWAIDLNNLNDLKINPLDINWNKETDVTVLYGPDLKESISSHIHNIFPASHKSNHENDSIDNHDFSDDDYSIEYSSSICSRTSTSSSIFESSHTSNTPCPKKALKFNDYVLTREIDSRGICHESQTYINDLSTHYNALKIQQDHALKYSNDAEQNQYYSSLCY
ncbi:hypothetical protein Kpol_489p19 [Vanderwaltozyma polyspora DSM 70294]|uniref:Uncharacterized protein n=1 Tax=Vanderwaltozyma polyspora (strain ATCC 22028 / DSM 70294 / BCRC 21397 / CBS 2163 / NBRC 10782 / NRRL Y-8283 / UCD 57-17) TaxID=436907 RepID=A7TQ33_VANPO|nr:uncharacterized protein Kpol_489p19 [Vanderwaltozyma polyspora DSM 70294]EDO15638.1 hypothetical protein Kpol_489p19 [Vanderwaltozyma polyspora DSM 70294]